MTPYLKRETQQLLPVQAVAAPKASGNLRNMAAMTNKLGLGTSPAAWPTGVSLLAQAVDACQRCDANEVCGHWLKRAPDAIEVPPAFCANADTFSQAKNAKD